MLEEPVDREPLAGLEVDADPHGEPRVRGEQVTVRGHCVVTVTRGLRLRPHLHWADACGAHRSPPARRGRGRPRCSRRGVRRIDRPTQLDRSKTCLTAARRPRRRQARLRRQHRNGRRVPRATSADNWVVDRVRRHPEERQGHRERLHALRAPERARRPRRRPPPLQQRRHALAPAPERQRPRADRRLPPLSRRGYPSPQPRGCSSMVELQPSKLVMRVRFPPPALGSRTWKPAPRAGFLLLASVRFFRGTPQESRTLAGAHWRALRRAPIAAETSESANRLRRHPANQRLPGHHAAASAARHAQRPCRRPDVDREQREQAEECAPDHIAGIQWSTAYWSNRVSAPATTSAASRTNSPATPVIATSPRRICRRVRPGGLVVPARTKTEAGRAPHGPGRTPASRRFPTVVSLPLFSQHLQQTPAKRPRLPGRDPVRVMRAGDSGRACLAS